MTLGEVDIEHVGSLTCLLYPGGGTSPTAQSPTGNIAHDSTVATQSPASPMTLAPKVDLCKDVEMCTETTNVWVPVPFPCLCRGKGQATSQTAEMMLVREYRSQPSVNGVLSSHTPTHPDGCS